MKFKFSVLILFVLSITFLHAQLSESITWEKTVIEDSVWVLQNLAIGKPYIGLFPSTQNYIYSANTNNHLVEYRYSNNQWIKDTIVPDMRFQAIHIGDGRNDRHERIYAFKSEKLYEIWYENFTWQVNLILEMTDNGIRRIVIGDGRDDGVNRIYATAGYGKIYELSFTGPGHNDWDIEIIDQDMYCQAIGDGRNDGINRIYGFGGDCNRIIYELTYNSVSEIWEREEVFIYITDLIDVPCGGLELGKARNNDDLNRLYWFDVFNYINETTWNGSSWDNSIVNPLLPTPSEHSYAGFFNFTTIDNNRVFFVHDGNNVYYFVNNNNIWLRYYIGEVIDPILGYINLVYGNIREKNALYAASLNRIIEFYPHYQ